MRTFAVLILTLTASGCLAFGSADDGCRFTAERNATLTVRPASQAKVIARAGKLQVQGRPGITDLRIRGNEPEAEVVAKVAELLARRQITRA